MRLLRGGVTSQPICPSGRLSRCKMDPESVLRCLRPYWSHIPGRRIDAYHSTFDCRVCIGWKHYWNRCTRKRTGWLARMASRGVQDMLRRPLSRRIRQWPVATSRRRAGGALVDRFHCIGIRIRVGILRELCFQKRQLQSRSVGFHLFDLVDPVQGRRHASSTKTAPLI